MEALSVLQENQYTFLGKECLGWLMHCLHLRTASVALVLLKMKGLSHGMSCVLIPESRRVVEGRYPSW